jgi:hypothetical protein
VVDATDAVMMAPKQNPVRKKNFCQAAETPPRVSSPASNIDIQRRDASNENMHDTTQS